MKFATKYLQGLWSAIRRRLRSSAGNNTHSFEKADQILLIGLMLPLMTTIVNMTMFEVALPTIRNTFGIRADVTAWVVTAYSLPYMLFMPLYGRLGDELGKRRLFLLGITVFLTGSLLISLAPGLRLLFLGRVIQGFGTAGITPLSLALITERFPVSIRGKALGTWNSIGPISGIIGPFLGGFLIDHMGWRAIFGPSILLGMVSLLVIKRQLPATQPGTLHTGVLRSFDWGGVVLLSMATTLLIFYVSSRPITGVEALRDWRLLIAALLLFGGFIFWEKCRIQPFVNLKIFRNKNFCLASLGSGIRMSTMSSIMFLMPLYLTDMYALNATSIGIITTLNSVALLLTIRLGGQFADRWNSRWPVLIGASVQMGVAMYFAWLPEAVPLGLIAAGLLIHGLGAGFALASLHRTSMGKILPKQLGMAAGLYSMIRFGGSTLGVALAGVVLQYGLNQSIPVIEAYQTVFWCIAGIALAGVIIAWHLK
jgi:EmrB/QacA subfamily drug resistance transporter